MGGGKGGQKRRVIDYHIDMHWAICWGPVDELREIRFKEEVAWEGALSSNSTLNINEPELFGGNEAEGGVIGKVAVLFGGAAQTLTDKLAGYLGLTGATAPGFRGIVSLWFHDGPRNRGFMVGQNNPYIAVLDAEVGSYPVHPNLNPAHKRIGDDANPIHMIFEIYTNSDWGLGWPVTAFNLPSWTAAAQTIFDEDFGLSMIWANPGQVENFVAEILDHIQAAVYTNTRTGLVEIKLFRDDYDIETAKTFNEDNCTLEDVERRSLEDTINEIVITYTDPETEEDLTVAVQDLPNIAAQNGQIKSDNRNYYGVRKQDLAWRLGERDLREASYPLFSCQIVTDRANAGVVPGEVVELQWPEEGITGMAVRVLDISRGKKGSGKVILSVVEDIWSLDKAEFEIPPTTAWTLPSTPPAPFAQQSAITSPYPVLSRLGAVPAYADTFVGLLAQQGDIATGSFTLTTEIVNAAAQLVEVDYPGMLQTPFGTTPVALAQGHTTVIPVANMPTMIGDFDGFEVGQLFYVGDDPNDALNEIVMLLSLGAGGWTVKRGLYDTVPRAWPAGTELWLLSTTFSAADPNVRPAGAAISYWLRPKTSAGTLSKALAPELVYTPSERPHLPFRPANVAVNGNAGFGFLNIGAAATFGVTWANRNRTLEDTVALHWNEANVAPEAGQTTTLRFRRVSNNAIVDEITGLTGTSHTVSTSAMAADQDTHYKMQVLAVRDGLESLQYYERLIDIDPVFAVGYGIDYGADYGSGT